MIPLWIIAGCLTVQAAFQLWGFAGGWHFRAKMKRLQPSIQPADVFTAPPPREETEYEKLLTEVLQLQRDQLKPKKDWE